MHKLKAMLKEQDRALDDLSSELQRREVTPDRVVRLVKIVSSNVLIMQRMADLLERLAQESGTSLAGE
jgi:hypothetical protein